MATKKAVEEQVKMIKVTLVRSPFGILKNQKQNLEALGLHKIGNNNTFKDDAIVRGMLKKVSHLVRVEEV